LVSVVGHLPQLKTKKQLIMQKKHIVAAALFLGSLFLNRATLSAQSPGDINSDWAISGWLM
jgi:hypothetical protein